MSEASEQSPEIQQQIEDNASNAAENVENEIIDQADDTVTSVTELRGEWVRYYARQGHARMQKITELAAQSEYKIELQKVDTKAKKVQNPFTGAWEQPFLNEWEVPDAFKRRTISQANWLNVEKARAKFNAEKDPIKKADLYAKLYEGLAYLYLGMRPEDFKRSDWEEMKLILDACNHRTLYGLPSQAKPSTSSSTQGGVG